MAFVYMTEFPIGDRSTANYDVMAEKLAGQEIDGLVVHTAGFDDDSGVWRQVDVWESREHADRFMEQLMADFRPEDLPRPDTAATAPTREARYELHGYIRGSTG